jgi:NhaP-type Na+/H+ or K+/H+ antiporter
VPELSGDRQLLELADAESIGHAGDVVGHARRQVIRVRSGALDCLRVREVVVEEPLDHVSDPTLLLERALAEIDALEHELPKAGHGAADEVALDDLSRRVGVLDKIVHEQVDPLAAGLAEDLDLLAWQVRRREHVRTDGVVDVVIDVGDPVDQPHDPGLVGPRLDRTGVPEDPVTDFLGEVQAPPVPLEVVHDSQRLLVVAEAPGEPGVQDLVERLLAGVAERRMSEVVPVADRLGEVFVQPQRPCDGPRDPARLERVCESRPVMVALGRDEHLRLVLQPPKALRMDDPVAIALERGAQEASFFWLSAGGGIRWSGERREMLRLQGSDPRLEGRGDASVGECVIEVCRVGFHSGDFGTGHGDVGPAASTTWLFRVRSTMHYGELILITGALLAAGLVASTVAARLRVPALLLFLGIGMAIGSDGTGWIDFDDYGLARTVGVIALALILFEGGIATGFDETRPVLRPALGLAFFGTIATALIAGGAASQLFDFSLVEGLLLGSILAATDGAAIFSVLRGSSLDRRLARTLEAESGLNDPVAVLLVIGFIDWIREPGYGLLDMLGLFAAELAIGAAVGLAVGKVAVAALRRARLSSTGLYPVASLATAALAFGAADVLNGSGFLAVYLAGLALGSTGIPARTPVAAFHDGLAWIAQIGLFFVLGLLVFPSQLGGVAVEGTVLALVLVLVARPAAAFAATALERFRPAERLVLAWAGLRGAVPVVLATFPVIEGVPRSLEFFNIVFFAVLLSTLLQGSTFEPLARRLGLTAGEPAPSTTSR